MSANEVLDDGGDPGSARSGARDACSRRELAERWRPLPMHQMRWNGRRFELCAFQSASKHCDDSSLVPMGGDDGVVASWRYVFGLPVERLDEGGNVVDDADLSCVTSKSGLLSTNVNAPFGEFLTRIGVLFLSIAPLGLSMMRTSTPR